MLSEMKKSSEKFIAKLIMWLISVSFIFFGFSKEFLTGGNDTAIKIAGNKISLQEFNNELDRQISYMERQAKEQSLKSYKYAFKDQIINNLIYRILLDTDTNNKGIPVSHEKIYEIIKSTKEFKDEKGNFSEDKFKYILSANNTTETKFINEISNQVSRDILVNAITSYTNNLSLSELNYKFNNEKRIFDYISIDLSKEQLTKTATDKELEELYKINSEKFKNPEYRKISYILITPEIVKQYKNLKDTNDPKIYKYMSEMAENISDEIHSGTNITEIQKNFKISKTTLPFIDINGKTEAGTKLQNKTITGKYRDIAFFAIDENGVSDLLDNGDNIMLLMVDKVIPAKPKELKTVKSELISIWKHNEQIKQANEKTEKIIKKLESGKNLKQALSELSYKYKITEKKETGRFNDNFSTDFLTKLFVKNKNEPILSKNDKTYTIGIVNKIIIPEITNKTEFEQFKNRNKDKYNNILLDDYIYFLKSKHGVKIYQEAINKLFKPAQ